MLSGISPESEFHPKSKYFNLSKLQIQSGISPVRKFVFPNITIKFKTSLYTTTTPLAELRYIINALHLEIFIKNARILSPGLNNSFGKDSSFFNIPSALSPKYLPSSCNKYLYCPACG